MTDPRNIEELQAFLEKKAVRSSAGTFVRLEDVQELVKGLREGKEAENPHGELKTFEQALVAAKSDPEVQAAFPQVTPGAVEGVKRRVEEE